MHRSDVVRTAVRRRFRSPVYWLLAGPAVEASAVVLLLAAVLSVALCVLMWSALSRAVTGEWGRYVK